MTLSKRLLDVVSKPVRWPSKAVGKQCFFDGDGLGRPSYNSSRRLLRRSPVLLLLVLFSATPIVAQIGGMPTPKSPPTMHTKAYDVGDLILYRNRYGEETLYYDALMQTIEKSVDPASWIRPDGDARMVRFPTRDTKQLVVYQSGAAHGQIERLLAALREFRRRKKTKQNVFEPIVLDKRPPETAAKEKAVREALRKRVPLKFEEKPLDEVAPALAKKVGVELKIDERALKEVGYEPTLPISIDVSRISLRSALNHMLRPLELTWYADNGTIWIGTDEQRKKRLTTKAYDVSGLVDPGYPPVVRDARFPAWHQELDDLLTAFRWCGDMYLLPQYGDETTCLIAGVPLPDNEAMIVRQTGRTHDEIENRLAHLRAAARSDSRKRLDRLALRVPVEDCLGLHGKTPPPPAPLKKDPGRDEAVAECNRLAFDIYGRLRTCRHDGAICFSPCAISPASVPGGLFELSRDAAKQSGADLTIVQQSWAHPGRKFPGIDRHLARLDLSDDDALEAAVRAWAKKAAGELNLTIPSFFSVEPGTLLSASCFSFEGRWARPFDGFRSGAAPFDTGKRKYRVAMMQGQDRCRYAGLQDLEVLEKPYAGGYLSMVFLLPRRRAGALDEVERLLSAENFAKWMSQTERRLVDVYLPRFQVETSSEVSCELSKLALDCTPPGASGQRYPVAAVHVADLVVAEEGPERPEKSPKRWWGYYEVRGPQIPVFCANRPFLFLLRDNRTGAILLLGRVSQPEAYRDRPDVEDEPFPPGPGTGGGMGMF